MEWLLVSGAGTHTAGFQSLVVAVLAADWTCVLKPVPTGIHGSHKTFC